MNFVDPKNDFAFKKIFGNEQHKEVLISFLNAVLELEGTKTIVDVKMINPYQLPDIRELKETVLDVKATAVSGEEFIVEMQNEYQAYFDKRSLYYSAKAYSGQLNKRDAFDQLKPVYFVGILNFELFESEHYHSRHLILDQKTFIQEIKDFEFAFIELKKVSQGRR